MKNETIPGVLIILSACIAMIVCNVGYVNEYNIIWTQYISLSIGDIAIKKQLLPLINEGLMALFFLLVTIEIRHEFLFGFLNDKRFVALPLMAAVGGMVVPALAYLLFNGGTSLAVGWAIPTATDIAFSLACLMLLGGRFSTQVRIFLLSLAIFDDLGAISIIAIYYSENLSLYMLVGCAVMISLMVLLNYYQINVLPLYLLFGFALWLFLLKSGVHATLAGCMIAMLLPMKDDGGKRVHQFYQKLLPFVEYIVLPVFAFANTGVYLSGGIDTLHPVALGIATGLVIGKPVGIVLFSFIADKTNIAKLPSELGYKEIFGVSLLCGIGFTMSLFVGMLAFDEEMLPLLNTVKAAVVASSLIAAFLGMSYLHIFCQEKNDE